MDPKVLDEAFSLGSLAYGAYKYEHKTKIISAVLAGISTEVSLFFADLFFTFFIFLFLFLKGPKNYSLKQECGKEIVKVRGFTITCEEASKVINHETMKKHLLAWIDNPDERKTLETSSLTFKPDRKKQTVHSNVVIKRYANDNFNKRWRPENCDDPSVPTYPFGTKSADFIDIP